MERKSILFSSLFFSFLSRKNGCYVITEMREPFREFSMLRSKWLSGVSLTDSCTKRAAKKNVAKTSVLWCYKFHLPKDS